ncbi:zinc transporter ZIP9-like [Macrosteles quadrilineatus]|uniref:zinc transporter ZIP9-like n=1 Tax=Macrosteles quadrilineatus TaxID=74068 RepID=UPI0023E1ACE1|nr:zinc transporter ZIP9-like [Macrosteles quadrilineatus]
MDETPFLVLLAFVMLAGSYFAGSIPLVMTLSEAKLHLISVFGAGLLVGTALAVIIPEGIRSLFTSGQATHAHTAPGEGVTMSEATEIADLHTLIGLSLVAGFILMLLIDQCSSAYSRDVEVGGSGAGPLGHGHRASVTATVGLVVHAAVDGVALGAAATTTQTDVEMIVFIAIMLHKAPAAFGLVTFLMHEGIDRKRIRRHLLVFSLAAPLLALVTYFGIGQEGKETLHSVNATGIAMLFSAGTFLYVATVHVLPELTSRVDGTFKPNQLFALIVGTILPVILTQGHHH